MRGISLVTDLTKAKENVVIKDANIAVNGNYFNELVIPVITVKAGTPTVTASVPTKAGDIYIDTAASKVYMAKAATVAADYLILN